MAFEVVPGWHRQESKNWEVSGGPGLSAAYGLAGNVMVFRFRNLDQKKTYPFAYVGGGVGLAFSADLGKFLNAASQGTEQAANTSGNPLSVKGLDKTTVLRPFSFYDLVGAQGGVFQASVAAVASAGVKYWQFGVRGNMFVRYEGPAVEAKIAVSVEPLNLTAGGLFPMSNEFNYVRREEFKRALTTPPSQNFATGPKW